MEQSTENNKRFTAEQREEATYVVSAEGFSGRPWQRVFKAVERADLHLHGYGPAGRADPGSRGRTCIVYFIAGGWLGGWRPSGRLCHGTGIQRPAMLHAIMLDR